MNDETMQEMDTVLALGALDDEAMRLAEDSEKAEADFLARQEAERVLAWCVEGFGHDDVKIIEAEGPSLYGPGFPVDVYECKVCGRHLEL